MMTNTAPSDDQDAAWVTIETPYDSAWLRDFLDNIERLYRINSQLEFEDMREIDDGAYQLKVKNLSNDKNIDVVLQVSPEDDRLDIAYSNGLKTATRFLISPKPDGMADLVITDSYGGTSAQEREKRIDEVDKSLIPWGRDLYRYLQNWKRWSWVPGWKWYMQRIWQPMKPSARRISYMLILITLAEFVFFLLIVSIFWLELPTYLE